jgi:hypothetical protein
VTKPLWHAPTRVSRGWTELVHLVPANDAVVPQYAVRLPDGWALTQGRDNRTANNATDDLILTLFDLKGKRLETRIVLRGGHGDRAYVVDGDLVTQIKGVWARVHFGSPWSWKGVPAPARCELPGLPGLQGEASLGGDRWLRLYGESIKGGIERDATHRTAFLQVIDGTKITDRIDVDKVARDVNGPLGGRYEPEGVSVAKIDGEPWVVLGFSVGQLGSTTMRVYGRPVADLA